MKDALRLLLQRRRSELRPEDYGFTRLSRQGRRPAGNGLSQLQVDELLGFGRGTYEKLEAGRYSNAPEHVLKAVGKLFRLNGHEWTWLWRMTWRRDPPYPLHRERDEEIPAAWLRLIDYLPHPAYITNYRYDLVAYNHAFTQVFTDQVPENTMEWMLLHPQAKTVLRDWAGAWAPFIAPHVWAARAAHPDDDYLADLEQRILADPDAGPIYKDFGGPIFVHPDGACRPFNHPVHGIGWVTLATSSPKSSSAFITMSMLFDAGEERPQIQPPLRARHGGT